MSKEIEKFTYLPFSGDTLSTVAEVSNTARISKALVTQIASRRDEVLFATSTEDCIIALKRIDEKHCVNRRGKLTFLDSRQSKLIYALAAILSQHIKEPSVEEYIIKISKGEIPENPPHILVNIADLTKLVSPDKQARARQQEDVIKDIKNIAEISQVQSFGSVADGKPAIQVVCPLITLHEEIKDLTEGKVLNADSVVLSFGRVFYYELLTKYSIIKPSLFGNWINKSIFNVLLSDLLNLYAQHRRGAIMKLQEINKKRKNKEEFGKLYGSMVIGELTYSEYFDTLKQRIPTDYDKTREQRRRFKIDLEASLRAIQKEGLITSWTFTQTSKGERMDVVFNLDYNKQREETLTQIGGEAAGTLLAAADVTDVQAEEVTTPEAEKS